MTSRELSPQTEQCLASVVASGLFPSAEAALEAAIEALREKTRRFSDRLKVAQAHYTAEADQDLVQTRDQDKLI
jgi:Arc/MetJ-type ribon-helix-helix transcriptional regulator